MRPPEASGFIGYNYVEQFYQLTSSWFLLSLPFFVYRYPQKNI
jgi:hypothetical protein